MAYFAVTYDLKGKEPQDYEELAERLEKMNSVKYQKSCWFVEQNKNSQQILDTLKPFIHEDDRLMVVEFSKEPEWNKALKGTRDWVNARF